MDSRTARLGVILAAACLAALAGGTGGCVPRDAIREPEWKKSSFFTAPYSAREIASGAGKTWEISGDAGTQGYCLRRTVHGRSDVIKLLIVTDAELAVQRIEVLSASGRRASRVCRPAFLDQLTGKRPGDAMRPGRDVDIVTGATISSRAIIKCVSTALAELSDTLAEPADR